MSTVNLTRAARRAERIPMPTIPKRVQIELNSLVDGYPILSLYQSGGAKWDDDHLSLSSYDGAMHVMLSIRDAHAAREYAQMLRGAADALLDWALQQEQPQNFAPPDPATRALNAGLDLLKQAGVGK